MKEGIFFLIVILGILFIVWKVDKQGKEGFQGASEAPSTAEEGDKPPPGAIPSPTIPLVSPRYQTLTQGEVKDFAPPSTAMLAPPPGQTASVNSLPAEDPALQKAPAGRIESVFTSIKGFLEREAPGLEKLGDPSVQLPLSTTKSDKLRLESELEVLKRNPGLESSLTQEDMNGIEANLGYLQNKWRNSVNMMSESPMPPSDSQPKASTEGFLNGAPVEQPRGWFSWLFGVDSYEGFQTTGTGTGTGTGSDASSTDSDVKLADLIDAKVKVDNEIIRLQISGTTDSTIQARIQTLSKYKLMFIDLIDEIETKSGPDAQPKRKETEIPFMKSDLVNFLTTMKNQNASVAGILEKYGVKDLFNSLFPKYSSGDTEEADASQKLARKYMEDITKNLSWDVGLHYKSEGEQAIAKSQADAMRDAKLAAEWSPTGKGSSKTSTPEELTQTENAYRGFFQGVVDSISGGNKDLESSVTINGKTVTDSKDGSAKPPGSLDWKKRANDICGQIQARGYNPSDFGCLENPEKARKDFPWRGYARMVCNRLATVYDPGVPELCGCPPPTWPGWRP